jgi:glycerol uptake facilitator-like aquaporin
LTSARLPRRATAELVGTAFLLIAVVGSGIAAQRLSPGDRGLALLENAVATGAALIAIILALGPVSGAHLNPLVTVVDAAFGGLRWREVPVYIVAQISGAMVGVIVANLMFSLDAITFSTRERWTGGTGLGEIVATLGLLLVIFGISRRGTQTAVSFAVGAYITGAYFFTSSTSFANPAVTIGRMLSNTFAGISRASVGPFIAAQLAGAAVAWLLIRWLFVDVRDRARDVVVPRPAAGDDPR